LQSAPRRANPNRRPDCARRAERTQFRVGCRGAERAQSAPGSTLAMRRAKPKCQFCTVPITFVCPARPSRAVPRPKQANPARAERTHLTWALLPGRCAEQSQSPGQDPAAPGAPNEPNRADARGRSGLDQALHEGEVVGRLGEKLVGREVAPAMRALV